MKLLLRGYGHGLQVVATSHQELQAKLLEEIRLLPGHKQKFFDLFKHLADHPHENTHNGAFTPTNILQKKMTALASFGHYANIHNLQQQETIKPIFTKKNSQRHFSPVRDGSISRTRQVLPKLQQAKSIPKKSQEKQVRPKEKSAQFIPQHNEVVSKQQKENKGKKLKISAQDDIILITEYSNNKTSTSINNKLLFNLQKVFTQDININLQLEQIKQMYQSFEGGRLCSTLINIDIEEICNCLASSIHKQMKITCILEDVFDSEFTNVDDKENDQIQTQEEQHLEQKISELNQYEEQFEEEEEQLEPKLETAYQQEEEQILDQTKSYFSLDATQVIDDHKLFNQVFTDKAQQNVKPTIEVIQNYSKNIMITTKMEREVAIIAIIYIDKLQVKADVELNCFNWQKILFTSLVIASKIWDDESFENNNFAKVLPQFTTVQINEMEKVFLRLIDYNLYVKQGDYAKQYFMLRAFADKKKRSFPLKQLDLKTVMMLQKRSERVIAKSQFSGTMNKSF